MSNEFDEHAIVPSRESEAPSGEPLQETVVAPAEQSRSSEESLDPPIVPSPTGEPGTEETGPDQSGAGESGADESAAIAEPEGGFGEELGLGGDGPDLSDGEPGVEDEPSDPFAAWPQAESSAVIEDVPEEGVLIEHVAGEIDVPDGYTVLEGTPTGHRRSVAVVVSRFNGGLTNRMLARAIETLEDAGVLADAVTIVPVPGAFELPLAAMALAKTRRYACVVALGAIVRGETPHFEYIASEAASGLQLAAIETGIPVAFGVLTVETVEQAEARIDRAADAVRTALEMADVFAQLRASAREA
jgi:6,7-dimethyl-8-ribityllumazine synthase